MCLGYPGKIIAIKNDVAIVDFNGLQKSIIISFVENVQINDYVMVHAGFAIEKITPQEAQESQKLWAEIDKENF